MVFLLLKLSLLNEYAVLVPHASTASSFSIALFGHLLPF